MAAIDISSAGGGGGTLDTGILQLENGVAMSTTLTPVTDQSNTASQLKLASNLTQIAGTLQIKTDNTNYVDIEDASGDNRFTISRLTNDQIVRVDFASNPVTSTDIVGSIRTYANGVALSEAMTFLRNGNVGVNTNFIDDSAKFQIDSTTRGFLPPRMTDTQRAAIASPAEGLMIFNTTNKGVAYRDGTNWGYLSGALQNATGSGGTLAISFAAGNIVNLTLTASTTLTFVGHVVGTYIIQVTQGGTGSYTLTYPASVKWSGGTAPTLTTTVGKTDILTFYHDGTSFFGTYSLNY